MRWPAATPIVLAAVAASPAPAHAAACAGADAEIAAASAGRARAAVRCLVNAERAAHGLPALRDDDTLAAVAQARSRLMVSSQRFDHDDAAGGAAGRATAAGYAWSYVAENIATGQITPREVVAGWMASAGHCRNILSPRVADIGVGVAVGGALPGVDGGTWTEVFGLRRGATAPSAPTGPQAGCPYSGLLSSSARASAPRAKTLRVAAARGEGGVTVRGSVVPARAGIPIDVAAIAGTGTVRAHAVSRSDGSFSVRLAAPAGGSLRVTVLTPGMRRLELSV
jgi:uncharacterized protein YkwD